jgi:hypothetical protein
MPVMKLKTNWHSEMIARLAPNNRCAISGCYRTDLQVDHKFGRGYSLHHMSESQRRRLYEEEEKRGLLRALCSYHNQSFGGMKSRNRNSNSIINCNCDACLEKKRKWNFKKKINREVLSRGIRNL